MNTDTENVKHLISIIIPAYNGSRTIRKTLESIQFQDFSNIETIIVDDASVDNTVEIAREALTGSEKSSLKIIRHTTNQGLSASLNDGLHVASGQYVLVLHQDCELAKSDWISTALKTMRPSVAVVTGYYGIPDYSEMNIAKKTFGILRRQIHTLPKDISQIERVNFTEGKCDLYDRGALDKAGGFPTRYRIAGEDLSLSIKLRTQGNLLVKDYNLPVLQRYGGKAETVTGNIWKEFEFGKAMGGVVQEHKWKIFKNNNNSGKYSQTRTSNRIGQVILATIVGLFVILSVSTLNLIFVDIVLIILLTRYLYYVAILERGFKNFRQGSILQPFITAPLGILSDFTYTIGFIWGMIKGTFHKTI